MAKRVNVRFLTILTVVVVAIAVAAALWPWAATKLSHRKPKHWIDLGDADMLRKDYAAATGDYSHALSIDPTNKEVCLHLGDAFNDMASLDVQNVQRAKIEWNKALEKDPQYVPALQRLLLLDQQYIAIEPTHADLYADYRDVARRLSQADPTDSAAKADVDIATVEQWLNGAAGAVSPQDFQHSLLALQGMLDHDPANPDLVYYVAQAHLKQRADALSEGQASEVIDGFDTQARAVVDKALALKPNDAALNLRAYEIFVQMSADKTGAHNTDMRTAAAKSADQAIAAAYANVKPGDASYSDIVQRVVVWDLIHDKKADAEAALRAYNTNHPDDLRGRVMFARFLAGAFGKRDEAIALLSEPFPTVSLAGAEGQLQRSLQLDVLRTLTGLQIDKCESLTDAAERQKMLAAIDPQIEQLQNALPDDPGTLRMVGAVQEMKGQRYEAIDSLSNARHLLEASANPDRQTYYAVLYQLGVAYMNEHQNGSAETTLEAAAQLNPSSAAVHHYLAVLYLQDQKKEQAAQQIDALAKADPDDSSLPGLRLAFDQLAHPDQAAADYLKLPEVTHADRLVKANAAQAMGNFKEYVRLLKLALQQAPNDPQISMALAGGQMRLNETDQAIATLQAQLRLTPDNDQIALVIKKLQNAPAAEVQAIEDKLRANTSDFAQAIGQYAQDFNNHKYDAALNDLKSAEHAGGHDELVAELYFQLYLARQQFEDAAGVVGTLARLNADDANGLTYQVRLAMAQNHREEAIRYAEQLTGARPELAMSWVMLGDACKANGQFDHALQNYRQALARQTLNADAITGEIDCYIALHEFDNAQATIARARQLFPDNQQFRNAELNYKLRFGNPADVVAELETALQAAPDDPNSYLTLVRACLLTADSRSAGMGDNGPRPFFNKAHDVLAEALKRWPNDVRFVPLMAQVEQLTGNYDAALKMLTDFAALPQWKNHVEPQLFLADLYNRAGKSAQTEAALRAAWAINKNDVNVQLSLARFLGSIGKFDDALAVLSDLSDPSVLQQRLQLLIEAGRYPEAETGLQAALAKAPQNVDLLYLMSVLHAATGHFDDAQADVKQGLSIDPQNVTLLLQSARIEVTRSNGDLDFAARQLLSLLQVSPKDLDAQVMLSDLYFRKGQLDAAIAQMESALALSPLNKPMRIRLARMYMSNDPPQWNQFDQLLQQAENNPQLNSDPSWLALEASGLFKRGQGADAVAKMRQAQAMVPDNMNIEHDYIDMLLANKQYNDAVQEIDHVLATGKRFWWLHDMRGLALVQEGKKPQAEQEFQAALTQVDADGQRDLAARLIETIGQQIDPDTALGVLQPRMGIDAGWRLLAVRLYEMKSDFASALKLADAVAADPLASSAQRLAATQAVAECAARQNLFDKAKTAYLSWLDQSPDDIVALNNLACLLNDNLKQPQDALNYSQKAYDLANKASPKISPMIVDTQGWVLVNNGGDNARQGRSLLKQLIQDDPEFIEARYHLAEAYLQNGQNEAAIDQLSSALDQIKTNEANHIAVSDEMKKNIGQAMTQARQAAAKAEATVR